MLMNKGRPKEILNRTPDSLLSFEDIWRMLVICSALLKLLGVQASGGATVVIEAETMQPSSDGWVETTNEQPEASNTTASSASKLSNTEGIIPEVREMLDRSHEPWQFSAAICFSSPLDASDFATASTTAADPFDTMIADLKIGTQPVNRILILGNSITLHGPAPKIGWTGNWGMAASSEDKDYVHLLLNRITEVAGGEPQVMVKNIAEFERRLTDYNIHEELKQELAFNADVIIIALGENAAAPTTDESKAQFASAFANLFAELKQHGHPTLFVRSQFWQDAVKDQLMKKACDDANGIFIDISKLGTDSTNFARAERQFEHPGVAGHPGDKGMLELSNALWHAIQKQGTPSD